jgi:hypothetical protein
MSVIPAKAGIQWLQGLSTSFPKLANAFNRGSREGYCERQRAISQLYRQKDTKLGDCFGRFRSLAIFAICVTVFMRMGTKARGYAVIPTVGKGGFGIGAARGRAEVQLHPPGQVGRPSESFGAVAFTKTESHTMRICFHIDHVFK